MDTLDPDIVQGTSGERWHDALNKINLGEKGDLGFRSDLTQPLVHDEDTLRDVE